MSASAASAGLVSFSNKEETTLADAEKHQRRLWRMQRGVIASARLLHNDLVEARERFRSALITFTYRPGVDWEPGHIRAAVAHYRKWCKRRGFRFRCVWTMELHKSGVPHYHLIFWMPRGVTPPKPDKQGWWPHGMTNCKWARSPVGYIAKYASKGADALIPKGARLWGAAGLTVLQRCQAQWCLAPRWLRRMTCPKAGVKRVTVAFPQEHVNRGYHPAYMASLPPLPDRILRLWKCMQSHFTFESPYEFQGFDSSGLVLHRREKPRCWSNEGDQFIYKVAI